MSFPSDVVINQQSAATGRTFTSVVPPKGGGTRRIRVDLAGPAMHAIDLKGWSTKSGVGEILRRTVSINWTEVNAGGLPLTMTFNGQIIVPRDPVFSLADQQDLVYYAKDFLSLANIEKLMRGEL